jgi:hypothetical protein
MMASACAALQRAPRAQHTRRKCIAMQQFHREKRERAIAIEVERAHDVRVRQQLQGMMEFLAQLAHERCRADQACAVP